MFFCKLYPRVLQKNPLFSHNWLKINYWHYLNLPKNTAQPSAPSPEAEGQAVERKIATVKCVVDCISQEFKQLFLGYRSSLFNNYLIIILFHISLLQLSQGLLFSCFYSCAALLWCVPRSSAEFTLFGHVPFPCLQRSLLASVFTVSKLNLHRNPVLKEVYTILYMFIQSTNQWYQMLLLAMK